MRVDMYEAVLKAVLFQAKQQGCDMNEMEASVEGLLMDSGSFGLPAAEDKPKTVKLLNQLIAELKKS